MPTVVFFSPNDHFFFACILLFYFYLFSLSFLFVASVCLSSIQLFFFHRRLKGAAEASALFHIWKYRRRCNYFTHSILLQLCCCCTYVTELLVAQQWEKKLEREFVFYHIPSLFVSNSVFDVKLIFFSHKILSTPNTVTHSNRTT